MPSFADPTQAIERFARVTQSIRGRMANMRRMGRKLEELVREREKGGEPEPELQVVMEIVAELALGLDAAAAGFEALAQTAIAAAGAANEAAMARGDTPEAIARTAEGLAAAIRAGNAGAAADAAPRAAHLPRIEEDAEAIGAHGPACDCEACALARERFKRRPPPVPARRKA